MNEAMRKQITSIMSDIDDMTIATVRADGYPQATTVSFVNDGLTLYFLTSTDSQKARNIERDGRVSVTIDRPYANWNEIESLSMAAIASVVSDAEEQASIENLFLKKFPQVANLASEEADDFCCIQVEPKWVSVLDYKKGFGHTELVDVTA